MDNAASVSRHSALTAAFALLALIAAASAYGQTVSLPQPEAPTTIFSSKIGSAEVDLNLQGSWNASLGFTTGLLFSPGLPVQPLDSFPGLAPGFIFTQAPDLTISLVLMRKYFLDVSVLSGVQNNTIRMGYKGDSDEVLRSLVIGNSGITIPPSPFLEIPAQPTSSIGASAELVSGPSTNDLLLRWDSTDVKHKSFVGQNEVIDQHITLESYMKGRYFFLPDVNIDVGSLVVYLEDQYGTVILTDSAGHTSTYRQATLTDLTTDTTNGLVSLNNAVKGRVVVYYTVNNVPVGNFPLGQGGLPAQTQISVTPSVWVRNPSGPPVSFNWGITYLGQPVSSRQVTLPGGQIGLMIWQPGDNSPFEIDNSYAFANTPPTDPSKIGYQFEATGAGASVPTGYVFRTIIGQTRYQVQFDNLSRNFQDFYPFYALDPSNLLYGPDRDQLAGEFKFDMHVQFVAPITSFTLEQNIVPGSVQVTINGITETRFQVDAASGNLTFQVPIQPTDQIDVTYRISSQQGLSGGDILFAWEDKIDLKNNLFLTLSAGLRWNADPWTFTQEAYSKSGTVIAAAELQGKQKDYSWMAQGAVSFTDPDTTGILLLFNMDGNAINLNTSEDLAYPASQPQETLFNGLGLTQSTRGYLFYTNFRQYGALGSYTLQPIDWSGAPSPLPYANNSRMGPFNVEGSSQGDTSGTSLVMQYQMDNQNNLWVGTQLPISPGSYVDLSSARSITIRLEGLNITGQTDVYVQVGSISEDLDGSGILKAKVSAADVGFPFTDSNPTHGNITLLVGAGPQLQGDGKLDSENIDGSGVLDQEDATRVVTVGPAGADENNAILSLAPGASQLTPITTGWQTITVAFSDQDRAKLLQARSVRIILVPHTGVTIATGYVLIDQISFQATPFWVQAGNTTDRGNITVQEIQEQFAPGDPGAGNRLADKFPQQVQQFHPNGEEEDVLEAQWGSPSNITNPFSVRGFTTQGTGGIKYQSVVAYVRMPTPASTGTTFDFTLYDSAGLGVHWQLNDAAFDGNVWHEMKVSRIDNTVKIDGNTVGQPVKFDSTTGDITQLQITVAATSNSANPPPSAGLFFIDEVYFTDPQGSFGAAFTGSFTGQLPGTVLRAGGVAILSNLSIQQDLTAISAGFSSLYGVPSAAEDIYSRTEVGGDLLVAHVMANVTFRDAAGSLEAFGGHKVTLPAVVVPLTVMDAFSVDGGGGFSREDKVDLGPVVATTVAADSQAALDPTTGLLTQTWLGHLSIAPPIPLNLSSDLQLSQSLLGYTLPSENYWTQWTQGFDLLLPWDGGLDYARSEKLSTHLGVPATPVGFTMDASAQAQGSNYALPSAPGPYTQESDAQLSANMLFKLSQDVTLSAGYKRLLSVITTPEPGPRFVTETDELLSILSQQGYMLTSIPVLELFSDNTSAILPIWENYGATVQASYNPALTLGVKRNYGSRLLDLFVPSSADLSVGQLLRLASSISETDIYITLATTAHAVNLFGRLGSIPRLPMITTDEYSINLSGSMAGNSAQSLFFTQATAVASASLLGEKETGLTFSDSFKWNEDPTTFQISLTNAILTYLDWSVHPDGGIDVPYLSAVLGKDAHFGHRESGSFALNYNPGNDYHPATLLLGHATSLVFPEHGTIKGSVNVGADTETALSPGLIWRLAVSFGIEAKLTF